MLVIRVPINLVPVRNPHFLSSIFIIHFFLWFFCPIIVVFPQFLLPKYRKINVQKLLLYCFFVFIFIFIYQCVLLETTKLHLVIPYATIVVMGQQPSQMVVPRACALLDMEESDKIVQVVYLDTLN